MRMLFHNFNGTFPLTLMIRVGGKLLSGLSLHNAQPHPLLKVGQRARIRYGAFAGMEGVVQRMKYSYRVVLTLDSIMQSFAVEVDGEELEILDPNHLFMPAPQRLPRSGLIFVLISSFIVIGNSSGYRIRAQEKPMSLVPLSSAAL